jgi:hypothetical protein
MYFYKYDAQLLTVRIQIKANKFWHFYAGMKKQNSRRSRKTLTMKVKCSLELNFERAYHYFIKLHAYNNYLLKKLMFKSRTRHRTSPILACLCVRPFAND